LGQLHYDGLPWRGELWLDDTLRLGPPSRDGGTVLHGFPIINGPQVILVDAQVEGIEPQDALSAFSILLRELAVFLSVVMRIEVSVSPGRKPRAWTVTTGPSGPVECEVRQLGYHDPNRPQEMPAKDQAPRIRLKPVNRPDFSLPGAGDIGETERWLPVDVVELWKQLSGLPSERRQQFLQAGNQWRLALAFASESETDSHAKMVVACEALKPPGQQYDHHNIYDVIEALWGKELAGVLREKWFRPQETRNGYFHRGELRGEEFAQPPSVTTFYDPSFQMAHLSFRCIPPAAILEWLRRGGNIPMPTGRRLGWGKKGWMSRVGIALVVAGGALCLALGWLLRCWTG
jgi:hypothetical protein